MGKETSTTPKVKRTQLTPAERVAKIEADLAAAKAKLHAKDTKAVTDLNAKREVAVAKITKLTDEVEAIDKGIAEANARINASGPVTDGVGES